MSRPFDFQGARALVVGGGTGLGAAMAEALAAHGAQVAIASRTQRPDARHPWYGVDVRDPGSVEALFSRMSSLNILVDCAGVNLRKKVEDISPEEWDSALRGNLSGAFYLARFGLPLLKKGGWGRFIVVGSVLARTAIPLRASYGSNKAGMLHLVRSLAVEWAPYGITANSISPGPFLTEATRGILADKSAYQKVCERIPAGRFGEPAEIVTACLFLASPQSSYVTGADIVVDGGWAAG
jgi:NAD(P)-dependent dehydrogenase (short-subunit alcohol dehydrogenase family)